MFGVVSRGRGEAVEVADEHGGDRVVEVFDREVGVVFECGGSVTGGGGLGDPQLHAVEVSSVAAGAFLGVGDAVAGGHQVQLAG